MSDEEEEFEVAASYAARLSASAEEGRRLSFGAKITLDDFIKEGGQVDQMLAFAMPSSLPLYNPFMLVYAKIRLVYAKICQLC